MSHERFGSGAPWEATVGYSRAVRALIDPAMLVAIEADAVIP